MSSVFECTGHLCHAWIFIVMTCEIRLSAFILSQGTAVQMAWFQLKLSSALIKCHSRCNGSCNFQTKWLFVTCPCAFRLRNKFYRFYLRTQVSWIPTYIYIKPYLAQSRFSDDLDIVHALLAAARGSCSIRIFWQRISSSWNFSI